MRTRGRAVSLERNKEGSLVISLEVEDHVERDYDSVSNDELMISISKYQDKRSLNANRYFWKLCDQIARELGTTKDAIYHLQLSKYGVFVDLDIEPEAVSMLKEKFRYTELLYKSSERVGIRCYFGSSCYDRKEMGYLINGTVDDARELGIDTWNDEEIRQLINSWEAVH